MTLASYILSGCSTADLSKDHFDQRDIHCIFFHYFLDDIEYLDDLGQSMSSADFYDAMEKGAMTKTSQVNIEEYEQSFRPFLALGKDILHICLSSGISGTYNSANLAAEKLREEFPERKIIIIDSLGASSGYGLLLDRLADLRDEGKSIDETAEFALKNRLRVQHWFFSTDLKYYVRGGRISKSSYVLGTALGICPLLNVDSEGKLVPREKIRTKKKVMRRIVEMMKLNVENGSDYDGKCYISQSACLEDAEELAAMIEAEFPHIKDNRVLINDIGTVIGSHTGPGTIALFFWGKERN